MIGFMKKELILFICLLPAGCAKVETAPPENIRADSNKIVSPPTAEPPISLKPVTPNVKFNAKRRKYLNESLPPAVREILEKAEKFEVLAEVETPGQSDRMLFEPNRIAKITDEAEKKEILEAFYFDASTAEPPAVCYLPHHSIRAVYGGKTVEIEICFECSRFFVKSEFGEFEGTIVRDIGKSEAVLKRIVENHGVELTK